MLLRLNWITLTFAPHSTRWRDLQSDYFYPRSDTLWKTPLVYVSLNTTILTTWSQRSSFIYPPCSHNLHFQNVFAYSYLTPNIMVLSESFYRYSRPLYCVYFSDKYLYIEPAKISCRGKYFNWDAFFLQVAGFQNKFFHRSEYSYLSLLGKLVLFLCMCFIWYL